MVSVQLADVQPTSCAKLSNMPEPLVIERNAELDLDVHELWTLISTSQGWSSWLVDHADIAVVTDAKGTAVDDGVERTVHIDSVTEGRAIGFSWWARDDPSSVSAVQLDIVELPEGARSCASPSGSSGLPSARRRHARPLSRGT